MGNSLTSSPCGQSQQQILQDSFNNFNLPADFLTPNHPVQRHGNVLKVQGKQNLIGNFFTTKNFFNIVDSKNQINLYYDRFSSKDSQQFPLVKVYGVKQMQQNNLCSSWKWYYVITEDIIPFNQLSTGLTFEQCVYILFQALMGFFYLYAKHRSFKVTQKMIGISSEGRIKVWLNQNYGQNHPQNQTIQLYLTRNYKSPDQAVQKQSKYILERQMIREIFNVLNEKYNGTQNTFQMTLRKRVRQFINEFSIKRCGFKDLLEALSIFQQKSGDKLYIPNSIKLQKEFASKLRQRESFAKKLERAIEKYNAQIIAMKEQEEKQKTYQTGRNGNSMLKTQPKKQNNLVPLTPQATFNMKTPWKLTDYYDRYNHTQDPKRQLVRYAESEMIGIGGTPFTQRMEEFNYRPFYQKANVNTYMPGDYENEIETLSKDMRETYFQSIGDSRSYLLRSRSITQDEKLSRSNSESQYYSMASNYTPITFNACYCIGSEEKNLSRNPSNKMSYNLMQIIEEQQAKQESIRPSLMSINVDGKNSFDYNKSKDKPNTKIQPRLSDQLQPIDQKPFSPNAQEFSYQRKYQQKRFLIPNKLTDKRADRFKSEPVTR